MKETEVVEVLEDGTIYVFDMDVCNQVADQVLDDLQARESTTLNYDFTATLFSLFINSVHILTSCGWTTHELIHEVIDHSEADDAEEFIEEDPEDD